MGEIATVILQFLGELLLEMVFEILAEVGVRSVKEVFRRRARPTYAALAILGYAILGAVAGWGSLWLFPTSFLHDPLLRMANLVATPLAAGALMTQVGRWRRRNNQELMRLDRFAYGFVFALETALVRSFWVH